MVFYDNKLIGYIACCGIILVTESHVITVVCNAMKEYTVVSSDIIEQYFCECFILIQINFY